MNIDERIEALTMNLELLSRDRESDRLADKERGERTDGQIRALATLVEQDAVHIRELARIAEIHHERLVHLEGGEG